MGDSISKYHELISEEEFDQLVEKNPDAVTVSLAVETFENEYPELSEEYKRISEEMYEMFARKHMDYGLNNIALGGDLKNPEDKKFSLTGFSLFQHSQLDFNFNTGAKCLTSLVKL